MKIKRLGAQSGLVFGLAPVAQALATALDGSHQELNDPGDVADILAAYLRTVNVESASDPVILFDGALLSLAARDVSRAQSLAARAQQAGPPSGSVFKDVWATRWGRSPLLTLALVAQSRGDQAGARHYFEELDQWLTIVEREG